ncbi:MAG: DUF3109 family protein [Saprospiraceae bacterium]
MMATAEYGTTLIDEDPCLPHLRRKWHRQMRHHMYEAGATDFQKPISCHLYPIRVSKNEAYRFEASITIVGTFALRALPAKSKLPIYQFLKGV